MKKDLQNITGKYSKGNNSKRIRKRKFLLYAALIIWTILLFLILTS
jgi:hypothetical protein